MTPETANGRGAIPLVTDGTLPVDLAPQPPGPSEHVWIHPCKRRCKSIDLDQLWGTFADPMYEGQSIRLMRPQASNFDSGALRSWWCVPKKKHSVRCERHPRGQGRDEGRRPDCGRGRGRRVGWRRDGHWHGPHVTGATAREEAIQTTRGGIHLRGGPCSGEPRHYQKEVNVHYYYKSVCIFTIWFDFAGNVCLITTML